MGLTSDNSADSFVWSLDAAGRLEMRLGSRVYTAWLSQRTRGYRKSQNPRIPVVLPDSGCSQNQILG